MTTKYDIGEAVYIKGTISGIEVDSDGRICYKVAECNGAIIPESYLVRAAPGLPMGHRE